MTTPLTHFVRERTDQRYFSARIFPSIQNVSKKKGRAAGFVMGSSLTIAAISSMAISYFTLEGSVRALIDLAGNNGNHLVALRSLGDAGGWTSLAVFSLLGLGTVSVKIIREGEYLGLKKICKTWIRQNINVIREDPDSFNHLYGEINDLFDAYQTQCLIPKNLVNHRNITVKMFSNSEIPAQEKIYRIDKGMENLLQEIKVDMDQATSLDNYFQRIRDGQNELRRQGHSKQLGAIILGVALPLILLTTTVMSCVGEVGLGKELFSDREALTDIGHFGEWPLNAVEAFAMAFFLHLWCMVNQGDFIRKKQVYETHLNTLKGDRSTHNRLADLANQELSELSNECHFFKYPHDYKFTKL